MAIPLEKLDAIKIGLIFCVELSVLLRSSNRPSTTFQVALFWAVFLRSDPSSPHALPWKLAERSLSFLRSHSMTLDVHRLLGKQRVPLNGHEKRKHEIKNLMKIRYVLNLSPKLFIVSQIWRRFSGCNFSKILFVFQLLLKSDRIYASSPFRRGIPEGGGARGLRSSCHGVWDEWNSSHNKHTSHNTGGERQLSLPFLDPHPWPSPISSLALYSRG